MQGKAHDVSGKENGTRKLCSELDLAKWALRESNPRRPACKAGALTAELSAPRHLVLPHETRRGEPGSQLAPGRGYYIENDDPQPQVLFAEGLLTLKPERCSSSWKSTRASPKYSRLFLSTTT
jgi:hypothetical protein